MVICLLSSQRLYKIYLLDIVLHRKKRLADKKYEFTDDEEAKDKFVPLTRLRSKKLAEAEAAGWLDGNLCLSIDEMTCISDGNPKHLIPH